MPASTSGRRPVVAGVLLVLAALAIAPLLLGSEAVERALPGGLPLGNALAAGFLTALAGAALALSPRGGWLRPAAITALLAALAWLPTSIALAGNLALNFGDAHGPLWAAFSALVLVGVLVVLACAVIATILDGRQRRA